MNFLVISVILASTFYTGKAQITGKVTCDNVMTFFADGTLVAFNFFWTHSTDVSLPDSTQVLAFCCFDHGVVGGIKGYFSNGIQTDSSWKCSNSFQMEWNTVSFDDSNWEYATVQTHSNWGTRPADLNGMASWIWTAGDTADKLVYCRKSIYSDSCDVSDNTLAIDPKDCMRFRQCVHGKYISMPCAPETGFSYKLQICDHLRNLPNCSPNLEMELEN